LPQNVRVQIWRETLKLENYFGTNKYNDFIYVIINYLCDEIGLTKLNSLHSGDGYLDRKALEKFFYEGVPDARMELNFRYAISIVEIVCHLLVGMANSTNSEEQKANLISIVDKINYRLREAKIGWTFNKDSSILMRIDNEVAYQLAIKPAFQILANKKFNETTSNFIKAYEAYQQGGYKNLESAVDYAIKTLESTIRNICKIKKYDFNENATLRPLIQVLIKNKYLPNYHEDYLNSIEKILLEGAVIRNKMTGHGKEEDKAKAVKVILNDDMVEFILSQVASCIVFLVKNL